MISIQETKPNNQSLPYNANNLPDVGSVVTLFNNKEIDRQFDAFVSKLINCRKNFMVWKKPKAPHFVAIPISCKSRFCEHCSKSRGTRARQILNAVLKERDLYDKPHSLKLLTLTVKNFPLEDLEWGRKNFFNWFTTLRHRKVWLDNVKGYFFAFEISKGKNNTYHFHLHILMESKFIDVYKLSSQWKSIVSKNWEGEVIDIREVRKTRKALYEVTKYFFKPASLDIYDKYLLSDIFKNNHLNGFGGDWLFLLRGCKYEDLLEHHPVIEHIFKTWVYQYNISLDEMSDNWVYLEKYDLWETKVPEGGYLNAT